MDYLTRRVDSEAAALIISEFLKAGLALEPLELERFFWLDQTLRRLNEKLDLTRIDAPRAVVVKHYVDSALAANLIEPKGTLMDLGSGAGFPGLPMAIMRPDWQIVLAEPRRKRLEFLEEVVDLLGLQNVEIYPHKVTANYSGQAENIIARDFGPAAEIVALGAAVLPRGGRLYLMKGQAVAAELAEAAATPAWREFGDITESSYVLGAEKIHRRLVTLVRGGTASEMPLKPRRRIVEIASTVNPRFKAWMKLLEGRNIKRSGEAVASGEKIVRDLLARNPGDVRALLAVKKSDFAGLEVPEEAEIFLLRPEIFPHLDLFGTGPPLLVVAAPVPPMWGPDEPSEGVRLFVPFQDPANVGAVIRSAAAFDAEIVLLREAANPFHPKALRASGPAVYQTKLRSGPSLAELAGIPNLWALSPAGRSIYDFQPDGPVGLVLGLEGPGLDGHFPPERRLTIPMRTGVESLNAAVAASVAMALLARNKA
ncbi:MAG: 16S rRNA (guanine(527)-N(7))-methyltransferase RsmG [Deltaproteobacteria bacterium]|jgi:16S rRNA (guanine527-N7)-methyltransferase|nr:16S rRNA (guanine(527)-N(7))-methyltransferase RsmG [Deltaproteobacteria bacterium]